MNTETWLERASTFGHQLDALGAELTAHESSPPVYPATNAADLLVAMKLKSAELRERLKYSEKTQSLIRQMLLVQTRMLEHFERAPAAIVEQSRAMMEM